MTYCTRCGTQNTVALADSAGEPFELADKPNVVTGDALTAVDKGVILIYTLWMCNDCGNVFAIVSKDTEGKYDN